MNATQQAFGQSKVVTRKRNGLPLTPSQLHYERNLSFRTDSPLNRLAVSYFLDCLRANGEGYVTAAQKREAICDYGFGNSIAAMYRAFRVYRRSIAAAAR